MAEATRRGALAAAAGLMAGGAMAAEQSVFDFRLESLDGGPLDLGQFRGRPMLIANTASFCGYTPQYRGLEALHRRLSPRGLVVLGAPSNDFNQESGDPRAIRQFCEATYDVQFPMTMPMHVRGPQASPLFAFLAARGGGAPRWNFHKYLVARDGRMVQGFATQVEPDAPPLARAIEAVLAAPSA
ncbi:MAG TPA: glutathione peroxidase [Crenalkalicoccus sp.]|nr:glutathione peroxidase [Crenalkalicoccus sp.]